MSALSALDIKPGWAVLDACSAPGGKSTQAAAKIGNAGFILSNEFVPKRAKTVVSNFERLGVRCGVVTSLDTAELPKMFRAVFDLVIADVPCSGEGMFRKSDEALSEWSEENVCSCQRRQLEIMKNLPSLVKPGGYLLYSTCTYSPEENEETVAAFLDRHADFSVCKVADAVIAHTADGIDVTNGKYPELAQCRRFYPHISPGEGQFVALLRRDEEASVGKKLVKDAFTALGKNDRAVAEAYCRETIGRMPLGLGLCGSNVVAFEAHETLGIPLPPFGVVAAGVALGELRKGRIVPHHHYFMAFGTAFVSKCVLDAKESAVERYLAGEEIDVPDTSNGLCAVCLTMGDAQIPLGGGKLVNGRLKNYYPKGLRIR
jgi:NOL1/NOP2/fmu family ribosome biogenesis protein